MMTGTPHRRPSARLERRIEARDPDDVTGPGRRVLDRLLAAADGPPDNDDDKAADQ